MAVGKVLLDRYIIKDSGSNLPVVDIEPNRTLDIITTGMITHQITAVILTHIFNDDFQNWQ